METAKLFSNSWNCVSWPLETVRTMAKGNSITLPVAFILVAS
jgi:hypothetical protein